MAVVALKSEQRCKLCKSPHRSEIDALLARRANRDKDEAGQAINLDYVLAAFEEWGVENPTEDNVKVHWRKHCEVVSDETITITAEEKEKAIAELLAGGAVDVNADLDWLWHIGVAEIRARIMAGEKSGISADLLMKIAAEKTRRQHNESQDELLRALTGGIAGAIVSGAAKAITVGKEDDVIEGVVVSES